jgi:RNA polymerase sigma factor (TIGR02999 family)
VGDPPSTRQIDVLVEEVYDQLRAVASNIWARGARDASIQPTMLVHEVFLKLAATHPDGWESRAHFLAVAARAMRQILADRARARGRLKRGGEQVRVTLTGIGLARNVVDLVALDAVLAELETLDPRRAQVVVLRVLGGLEETEVAEVLGVTDRTVRSDWRAARAWLVSRLEEGG